MSHFNPDINLLPASSEDLSRRSIRVLNRRENGFVEFEFSIGWPELALELVLSEKDFLGFCKTHSIAVPANPF